MGLDDPLGKGEAESRPLQRLLPAPAPVERIEAPRELIGWDPFPAVGKADHPLASFQRARNLNLPLLGRMLDGIVEQVEEELADAVCVARNGDLRSGIENDGDALLP